MSEGKGQKSEIRRRRSEGGRKDADQIRRSSRSVCSNLRESWAKRRYEAHFISKLTDADGENSETDTWLDFARDCKYISIEGHDRLTTESKEVGAMIGAMIKKPEQFLIKDH